MLVNAPMIAPITMIAPASNPSAIAAPSTYVVSFLWCSIQLAIGPASLATSVAIFVIAGRNAVPIAIPALWMAAFVLSSWKARVFCVSLKRSTLPFALADASAMALIVVVILLVFSPVDL